MCLLYVSRYLVHLAVIKFLASTFCICISFNCHSVNCNVQANKLLSFKSKMVIHLVLGFCNPRWTLLYIKVTYHLQMLLLVWTSSTKSWDSGFLLTNILLRLTNQMLTYILGFTASVNLLIIAKGMFNSSHIFLGWLPPLV